MKNTTTKTGVRKVSVQCKKCLHIDYKTADELKDLLKLLGYFKDECGDELPLTKQKKK